MLGNNSNETENQNVATSTDLHLDESGDLDTLPNRKPKKKRRPESRHCPPGKKEKKFHGVGCSADYMRKCCCISTRV